MKSSSAPAPVAPKRGSKSRRQSWVKAETDNGETFFYDDPSLGGSGKTQWETPEGEALAGEYVERVEKTEITYNKEWSKAIQDDGTTLYTSNTGDSQTEAPPGFE